MRYFTYNKCRPYAWSKKPDYISVQNCSLPRFAPIGVCSLVAARVAGLDDILSSMGKVGLFMVTDLCGLLIHSLIVLPLVFFVVTRRNPYVFMKGLGDALMTAFSIASRCVS